MSKRFYEVKGNFELHDRNAANKIAESFLKLATDKNRQGAVWITRSEGMGKENKLWSSAQGGIHHQGATHTKQEYYDKKTQGKIKESRKFMRPRTSLGAIITHTAKNYNRSLLNKLTNSGLNEEQIKEQFKKQAIRVKPVITKPHDIKKFGFKRATQIRDESIKALGEKQLIAFTRSGTVETKNEMSARKLYESLQEVRKETGFKSKGASDKLVDAFIDEVNVEIDGKPKYDQDFKEGAANFLKNKELDMHFDGDPDVLLLTEQRREDIRKWSPGSQIAPLESSIPQYKDIPGKDGSDFVGNTLIHGQTISGPELPENIQLQGSAASGDYAFGSDYLAEGYPDDYKSPTPITTSGDEGPPAHVVKETLKVKKMPVTGSMISSSFGDITEMGGQIEGSRTSDAVKELVYGFEDDIGETIDVEGPDASKTGFETHSIAQANQRDILERKAIEDINFAAWKGGWGQFVHYKGVNKGLSLESPKVMKGAKDVTATDRSVYQTDPTKPDLEDTWGKSSANVSDLPRERKTTVRGSDALSGERVGSQSTVRQEGDVDAKLKVVGDKEVIPKYIPTVSEQKRQDALSKMSPVEAKDAKEQYVQFRNQKIKEYNVRMQKGTQKSFIHQLKSKNRMNAMNKAPVEATGNISGNNPASKMLNPKGKGPGIGKVTKSLVVGGFGLGGLLAAPYFASRSLQAKNIKDPTVTDYLQETGSELVGSKRVWSGVNEKPGYFQKVGLLTKGVEGGRRPIKPIPGAGGPDTPAQSLVNFWTNMFKSSTKDAWKNRKRN